MIFGAYPYGGDEYGGGEPLGPDTLPSIYAVVVYGTFTGKGLGDSNWARAQWGGRVWGYGVVGTLTSNEFIFIDWSGGFITSEMSGGFNG